MKPRIGHGHGHVYNRHPQIPNPNPNRTTFMPILCSKSMIKNVHLPNSKCQRQSSADPSSPKIGFGCMGQTNRTNRINGFPTPNRLPSSSTTSNTNIKYQKLKRMFSGKRVETNGERIVQSCREIRSNCQQGTRRNSWAPPEQPINLAEMDPPLPVVKRVQPTRLDGREDVSLWKRRSAGIALKTLQITG